MKKLSVYIILITFIAKLFGLGRDLALSYVYGASNISDAYLVSITVPTVIFSLISISLAATFIPMFENIQNKKGREASNRFVNIVLINLLFVSTIIIILIYFFSETLVYIFASGFEGNTLIIATDLLKINVFILYFSVISTIFGSLLQIRGSFLIPAFITVPFNILIVFSIIASGIFGYPLLSIGLVFASIVQVLILVPFVVKQGFDFYWIFDFKNSDFRKMIKMSAPVLIGSSVTQVNIIIDRTLASRITSGGISALNYGDRLTGFAVGLFVISVINLIYPKLCKYSADLNLNGFKDLINKAIFGISLFIIPMTVGFSIFTKEIIELLFFRGEFNETSIMLTSGALAFYSLGMMGFSMRELLSRIFFSLSDTKTPVINASLGIFINIVLNIILSRYFGIGGLALATSIAATVTTLLLLISLRKKIGPFGMKQISISFLKILFASLVMGGLAKLSFNYLTSSLSQSLSLLLAIGVAVISYFMIIYFMKIEDVDIFVGAIKKKIGRGTV